MKRYRFLILAHRFYPAVRGAENLLYQISLALKELGHSVDVYTYNVKDYDDYFKSEGPLEEHESIDGINIRRFNMTRLPGHSKTTRFFYRRNMFPHYTERGMFSKEMIGALRSIDHNCIIAGAMPFSDILYAGVETGKKKGIPVFIIPLLHLGIPGDSRYEEMYYSREHIEMYNRADNAIVLSDSEAEFLTANGFTGSIIKLIPRIERYSSGNRENGEFTVCSLGYVSYDKGIEQSLKAFEKFSAGKDNVRFIIAGEMNRDYEKLVTNSAKTEYLGVIDDKEKAELYKKCDIYLQPSIAESLGLAVLEAHSAGIPSINAYCSGTMEIIKHGENGFLVPFGDYKRTAEYMEMLYSNKELRKTMGQKAEEMSRRFNHENLLKSVKSIEKAL